MKFKVSSPIINVKELFFLFFLLDPSSFKFSDEPVEDKLGHYYAVKDKFNANFTDEEMTKATEKGQVLASRGRFLIEMYLLR